MESLHRQRLLELADFIEAGTIEFDIMNLECCFFGQAGVCFEQNFHNYAPAFAEFFGISVDTANNLYHSMFIPGEADKDDAVAELRRLAGPDPTLPQSLTSALTAAETELVE